jgi:hypothetical protein
MSEMISPMVNELNEAIEELEVYNFITRDIGLQKTASQKLALLLERVKKLKQEASERLDEDAANTLLGYEYAISFLIASISMWVLLKDGKADEAWDRLVDSQQFVVDAIRSHRGFAHMQIYGQRLATLESLIFPPQTFLSVGMIVRKRLCSICGEEYGECNHLGLGLITSS